MEQSKTKLRQSDKGRFRDGTILFEGEGGGGGWVIFPGISLFLAPLGKVVRDFLLVLLADFFPLVSLARFFPSSFCCAKKIVVRPLK